jgi:hypothetical protein
MTPDRMAIDSRRHLPDEMQGQERLSERTVWRMRQPGNRPRPTHAKAVARLIGLGDWHLLLWRKKAELAEVSRTAQGEREG